MTLVTQVPVIEMDGRRLYYTFIAGARGFVFFVEGIIDFIANSNLRDLFQIKAKTELFENLEEVIPEKVYFRYCTEALIKNSSIDNKSLLHILEKHGNYIVLHANNNDAAQWYSEKMETLTNKKPASVVNISPIIGANAGIGAAAVALLFD